jgi:hypothetical protein
MPTALFHLQGDHIGIAVEPDLVYHLHVAGFLALVPQLLS